MQKLELLNLDEQTTCPLFRVFISLENESNKATSAVISIYYGSKAANSLMLKTFCKVIIGHKGRPQILSFLLSSNQWTIWNVSVYQVVMLIILFLFALVHSGLASLRGAGEKLVGERAYRVLYAASSLPLAVSAVVSIDIELLSNHKSELAFDSYSPLMLKFLIMMCSHVLQLVFVWKFPSVCISAISCSKSSASVLQNVDDRFGAAVSYPIFLLMMCRYTLWIIDMMVCNYGTYEPFLVYMG